MRIKHAVLLLSLLSAFNESFAQSSVTLYGAIDANVRFIKYQDHGTATSLGSWGNSPSLWGLLGSEDLGGGLKANFRIEAAFTPWNGGTASQAFNMSFFNRGAWIGLSSPTWGEFQLGRNWNVVYNNNWIYDPSSNVGVTNFDHLSNVNNLGLVPNYYFNSNAITYFTPDRLAGFYATLQVVPRGSANDCNGNITCTTTIGSFVGGNVGYKNGPLQFGAALGQTGISANTVFPSQTGKWTQANVGISYNFNIFKVAAWFNSERLLSMHENIATLGVTVPVGIDYAFASAGISRTNTAGEEVGAYGSHQFGIGYVHPLSKRTVIYGAAAYLKNSGNGVRNIEDPGSYSSNTLPGTYTTGFEFGMRHNF